MKDAFQAGTQPVVTSFSLCLGKVNPGKMHMEAGRAGLGATLRTLLPAPPQNLNLPLVRGCFGAGGPNSSGGRRED